MPAPTRVNPRVRRAAGVSAKTQPLGAVGGLPGLEVPIATALAAFTSGTARVNHLEHEAGSIEIGKAADLVVLDRDLFDRGVGAIGETRVVATFIEGVAVHEAPALEA